ncbi:DUF2799 domain-containing protein [Microbulbifer sp. 2304DJ12-6]|uniref:DUF2799 domain-containing protein n=1 Tax=Microbulbifer sp. 2304DJ12-6 TaxID=3233340 RepID=UPI0039B03597
MSAKLRVSLLFITCVVSGCAVVSEEACHAGLWYERGLQDGARGRTQSLVYEIARECQNYGVHADSEAWLRGHEEGVEQFCTAENGFYQGRRGHQYAGVCIGPTADLFLDNYQRGLAEYRVEQRHRKLHWRRDALERELHLVHRALDRADSDRQRRALYFQRSRLSWALRSLDMELHRYGLFGPGDVTPGFYPPVFFSSGLFYW